MDHGDEDDWAYGNIPECGAIFMSDTHTKKECFRQKIFALPSSHTEFVTHIKVGMVLFLFEFRSRRLFGVYQATSDGAVDIIPNAFKNLRQHFPAQVRFRQIWHCDPLSEKEFRDAIKENYFSANKFNFGLSNDQVRKLLGLFSSRKVINKMPPQPLSEAIVQASVRDKRRVGDDRHGLSERGYIAPAEYDEINGVAFHDRHVSSLARGKEDDVFGDDRFNAEGKVYPFPEDDFLAKRRRIGEEGRLTTINAAENGPYNHGYRRAFCTDSPKDSFDKVRRFVSADRLSTVQMVNENRVNEMYNPIQSSEHSLDQLDVRSLGDYTRIQRRSRLLDDCNMHNGRQQAFASDYYGNSAGQDKYSVNGDSLLLDDSVKTDCNIDAAISMSNSDYNLNLCREARKIKEDQEWLMNRELENGRLLDCDGSTISAFNPSERFLHKKQKTSAAGFQIGENEPDFGTCSFEGFSSENVLHQLQSGYRIIEGMKYPIVEGRSTENMSDKVPPILATDAGYTGKVDLSTVDNERFRQSERLGNQESSYTHTNPVMSMKYPCFSKLEPNLSPLSDKLVPEIQPSQFSLSRNFNLSHCAFDDATITMAVPYSPDHPNLSHGCTASNEANRDSTRMQNNHLHDGSLGNFYPVSSNRPQQYYLESEKSGRPLDSTLGFGNKGFVSSTSGLRSSLLQESSDSYVNPNFFSDMDLNTSAPDNYRGSLVSKISPTHTGLEKIEGKKGLLPYYSKSRDRHHAFDGNLHEASEKLSKHAPPQHGMVRADTDFSSKSKFQPETDLGVYENQYFRFSNCTSLKKANKFSEANTTPIRRSVFTRLSSKESSQFVEDKESSQFDEDRDSSQFVEERNVFDVNSEDCYMDSTADEVMQMLQQNDNLSLRKVSKSRVVGKPRESIVNETKTPSHVETDHSTVEKKYLNNASQANADCMDEIPKETRTFDFKRRSDKKKNFVRIGAASASHSKTTGANEEVNSSTNSTLRRKKLVRPVFGKTATDIATFASHGNETVQIPAPNLDKDANNGCQTAISLCEFEIPGSSNLPEEQKDVVAHVLTSASVDLKGHEQARGDDLHIGSSNVLKEIYQQKGHKPANDDLYIRTSNVLKEISMQKGHKQASDDDLHIGSSNVLKETSVQNGHEQANDDLHIGSSNVEATSMQKGHEHASSDDLHIGSSNALKETSMQKGHEQENDDDLHIGSSNVLQDTSMQKGHEQASDDDLRIGSSDVLKETSQQKVHNQANDCDLYIGSSNVLNEASLQKGHNQANDGDLYIGTSNVLMETSLQKGHEQASDDDLRIGSSHVLKKTSQQKRQNQANDGDLYVGSSNVLKETSMQKGHEQANDEDLHIGSSNVLEDTSMHKGHEQASGDDLHFGRSNVLKETSQQKSLDIQTSVAGILAKDNDTTIIDLNLPESSFEGFELGLHIGSSNALLDTSMQKGHEQTSDDDHHIGSSNVLNETSMQEGHGQANDEYLHIVDSNVLKETSQQKSLDIQTSVAGILANDTDTTIMDLNLPESSLEGFKLGAGCGNNLIKEEHLRKMKIILSTKRDVNASSQ